MQKYKIVYHLLFFLFATFSQRCKISKLQFLTVYHILSKDKSTIFILVSYRGEDLLQLSENKIRQK